MSGPAVEVSVVEDHPLYRAALVGSLTETPGVRVGAAARSVEEFLAYRRPAGTVVLLDLSLPGVRGAAAVLTVVERGHRVLVVSAQSGRDDVLSAIAAGAKGYLTKAADGDEVIRAIRTVSTGGTYVSPTLASILLDSASRRQAGPRLALTARERQVLSLLAAGERDVDIARALSVSVRTIRSHLDRIREKTGRRRRPELTRLAIEEGIVMAGIR
ncbi:response regulator transcription factor [Solwaraspora sp. WMMD1047]|uniref:response regulator n=1 Tax=Solwaraspora sp. WMMD1047 TaxID=3016102 RepID=UPI00241762C2|nr:response regulator transcription factor [Solwaraspora sp. WMMD1047]MDG4829507.1 response regulator transcription factor [Solwaraspora sp. WMMD1047]